jgi:multimeric flavodoxin WrbA
LSIVEVYQFSVADLCQFTCADDSAGPKDVIAADGYIFATPENLASMSGLLKDSFDRTYYAALDRINGRPYGTLVCAGSDGQNAVRQIERIATGWRLKAVVPALILCARGRKRRKRFCGPSGSRRRTWRNAAKWAQHWLQGSRLACFEAG